MIMIFHPVCGIMKTHMAGRVGGGGAAQAALEGACLLMFPVLSSVDMLPLLA